MCDFKPGDEVVCVNAAYFDARPTNLVEGASYTVREVLPEARGRSGLDFTTVSTGVRLFEVEAQYGWRKAFDSRRFRKVERRNDSLSIEAFLTIKPGFEEPKRAPAKKRERV